MRPGAMDRVVTLQLRTLASQNTYGEEQYTWTDYDIWAERRELRGDERYAAEQTLSKVDCRYRIRYREDVTPKDRLVDDERTYQIHAVLPLGRREGVELLCSSRGGE